MNSSPKLFDRRRFLRGVGLSSMALGLARFAHGQNKDNGNTAPWQPRQCLSSVMFSQLPLAAFCAKAAELGFKGIDLWGPFRSCRHMIEAKEMGPEAFLKLLKQHDLQIGAWTCYRQQNNDRIFNGFAEFIGACGGGIVVRGTAHGDTAPSKLEASISSFYAGIADQIELARKHHCRIALENHDSAILDSPESFELFTKLNPAPEVVGFAIAPYHLQRRKADVAEVIRKHGDKLLFFYAWQSGEGTKELPGQGEVDFKPWLQALAEVRYQQWMTPFTHGVLSTDDMAAAVGKAKRHLESIQP